MTNQHNIKELNEKVLQEGLPTAIVLTAIKSETKAVLKHLEDRNVLVGENGFVYEYGYFYSNSGKWFVVVVEAGPGNYNATSYIHLIIRDFNETKYILFVGVAGSLKADIKIGQVLASSKVYGYHSGKAASEFQCRPELRLSDDRERLEPNSPSAQKSGEKIKNQNPIRKRC